MIYFLLMLPKGLAGLRDAALTPLYPSMGMAEPPWAGDTHGMGTGRDQPLSPQFRSFCGEKGIALCGFLPCSSQRGLDGELM